MPGDTIARARASRARAVAQHINVGARILDAELAERRVGELVDVDAIGAVDLAVAELVEAVARFGEIADDDGLDPGQGNRGTAAAAVARTRCAAAVRLSAGRAVAARHALTQAVDEVVPGAAGATRNPTVIGTTVAVGAVRGAHAAGISSCTHAPSTQPSPV